MIAASRGSRPYTSAAMAASTRTDGSRVRLAPRSRATSPPGSPVESPWTSPIPRPSPASTIPDPAAVMARWPPAQRSLPTGPARTASARPEVSSARSRRVA
ncbi:superantigen-like protein SSL4 [Nonomuraea glycinis]|uniref:hypothetical protein n=1 Tax=Nonomuraea glycinis TaxID=2047744 RepID=UPI002E126AA3|nr:hypothetical protein OHA68_34805 [Nonomuraea glycinis]